MVPEQATHSSVQVVLKELPDSSTKDVFRARIEFFGNSNLKSSIVDIKSPLTTEQQEKDLLWYSESSDRNPFRERPKLQRAEKLLKEYGNHLFSMLFTTPESTPSPDEPLTIRVIGTPRFCSLHWELLSHPHTGPVALRPKCSIVRDVLRLDGEVQPILNQMYSYPTLNVLFLTARTRVYEPDIPLRVESLAIMDTVYENELPLRLDLVRPGTLYALRNKLSQKPKGFYHIFHIDCHGADGDPRFDNFMNGRGSHLVFEDEEDKYLTVSAAEISELVDAYEIPIVVTSACRSGMTLPGAPSFAYDLFQRSRVQCVLAMAVSVLVDTSAVFFREFYRAMLDSSGKASVSEATSKARRLMFAQPERTGVNGTILRQDWWIPQHFERYTGKNNEEVVFSRCSLDEASTCGKMFRDSSELWEDNVFFEKRTRILMHETINRQIFLGRDEDLRMVECKVFSHKRTDNILLLHGMMGCGKTAFMSYVSWWWTVTGLVRDRFIFRLHERIPTLNEMIWHIYRQIFTVTDYDPTDESVKKKQMERVTKYLLQYPYVVVIDSAERLDASKPSPEMLDEDTESRCQGKEESVSITSATNDPTTRIQDEIAEWLGKLHGGKTVVLIGSRGNKESNLMKHVKSKSNGLDLVVACQGYPSREIKNLPDKWSRALVQQLVYPDKCDKDSKYKFLISHDMLHLCGGNPLVINMLVGNFKSDYCNQVQSDSELSSISQLYLSDQKTSVKVVDSLQHSYRLLRPQEQQALLFLAPFKASFTAKALECYANELEKCEFQYLQFDRSAWNSALKMAARWGLLTAHERVKAKSESAWRMHACLPLLLQRKLEERLKANSSKDSRSESSEGPNRSPGTDMKCLLDQMDKPMHVAYWKWGLELFHKLGNPDMLSHREGCVLTEIDFWNLNRSLDYALKAKEPFYGILLPLYWYFASKNDITQRYELCVRIVDQIGNFNRLSDVPASNEIYKCDIPRVYHLYGMLLGHNRLRKLAEAEKWYEKTKKIWEELGKTDELAVTEHELGWVHMNKGEYDKAWYHYQRAVKLSEPDSAGRTWYNMGLLASFEEKYELAIEFYKKAGQQYAMSHDERAEASVFHHLGIVFSKQQKLVEATKYAERALATRRNRLEGEQVGNGHHLLGNIALRRAKVDNFDTTNAKRYLEDAKRRYEKAMRCYNSSAGLHYGVIPEREILMENFGILMVASTVGESNVSIQTDLLTTAIDFYERLMDGPYPKTLYNLGLIYEMQGNYKGAYECFTKSAQITPCANMVSMDKNARKQATYAKARCLATGKGVEQNEYEALTTILRQNGVVGNGDPLDNLDLP